MRRTILVLALLGCSVSLVADDAVTFEQLTVSSTAVHISAATLKPDGQAPMQQCFVVVETAAVRYRFDGTAPTDSVGVILADTDTLTIPNAERANRIQFIRDTTTDALLNIHCWR